ncbi:MAG: hypothetical protein QOI41_2137 [Myxococcales bacterium]|nr:hypothetical protein [Myxococcales bacterium]
MTLSTSSLSLASLTSLALASLLALGGCAADTTDASSADGTEDPGVSQDELTSRAAQFAGAYSWRASDSGEFVDFQQLTLKANGSYTAKVDAGLVNPAVRCIAFPCTLPEAGKWTVLKSGSQLKLKVDPTGPKPSRSYYVTINDLSRTLSVTRYAHTSLLFSDSSTCANVRCTATTHCEMKGINGGAVPVCIANPPAPPPAAACVPSGCSGQICADHSVISTCEFRPEYACYQTATCARQADGACGWTSTPALTSCLANAGL